MDHFIWQHGNKVFDELNHHSKVCLLSNHRNSNLIWFHEADVASEVAAVLTLHCPTSKFQLAQSDGVLNESLWNGGIETATHLVSAVQYGVQVSCVFQRYLKKGEAVADGQREMLSFINELTSALMISEKGRQFKCANEHDTAVTVYGMNDQVRHLNCRETYDLLKNLMANENFDELKRFCEPLRVWLRPLDNFNGTLRDIGEENLNLCRDYLDRIGSLRAQANTLLNTNDGVKHFTYTRPLLHAYREMLDEDETLFRSELHQAVVGFDSDATAEIIQCLTEEGKAVNRESRAWLDDFKNEVRILNTIAVHARELSVPLALEEDDIYRVLVDPEYEYVCIFGLPPINSQLSCYLDQMKETGKEKGESYFTKQRASYSSDCSALKRDEFYRKVRQFFKDASNSRKYQTGDGSKVAFLMTPLAFQSLDNENVAVYRNGTLMADGSAWLKQWQSELERLHREKNSYVPGISSGARKETQMVTNENQLGDDTYPSSAIGQNRKNASKGRDNQFNDDEFNFLQRSSESLDRSKDSSINDLRHQGHVQDFEMCSVENLSSTISLQQFDIHDRNGKGSADFKSRELGNRQFSMSTASQDSLTTIQVPSVSLKDALREKSRLVTSGDSKTAVYALPMTNHHSEKTGSGANHYVFNQFAEFGNSISMHHRTVLLMGAAGSDKTSLINSMINYVLGVEWDDDFRFELPETATSKAAVTSYDINHVQGMQVPFSLTIIDTPGYGGKQGTDADKHVTESIRKFFKDEKDAQVVDAVCFVCSAHETNSPKTQEYILHSMLSVFGKDVKDNIQLFFTFSDSKAACIPDVVSKVKSVFSSNTRKEAKHYLVSNRALYGREDTLYDDWCSSAENLEQFFDSLILVQSKSLLLTQQVLDERKRLERLLEMLRPKINEGLFKMDEIQKYRDVLSEHETSIDNKENVDYEIQVAVMKKVGIKHGSGKYLTNCQVCQMTCHYPCAFREDQDKRRCSVIDGKTGFCRECPNKCSWSVHFSQTFRWVYDMETRRGNVDGLREKYDASALTTIQLVQVLETQFKAIATDVLGLVDKAAACIQRLERMALIFNPCTTSSYIAKMIDSERKRKLPGYEQRVANLRNVLEMAELSDKIYRNEPLLPQSARLQLTQQEQL